MVYLLNLGVNQAGPQLPFLLDVLLRDRVKSAQPDILDISHSSAAAGAVLD